MSTASTIFLDFAITNPEFPSIQIADSPIEGQQIIRVQSPNVEQFMNSLSYEDKLAEKNIVIISPNVPAIYSQFLASDIISQQDKDTVTSVLVPLLENASSDPSIVDKNLIEPLFENYIVAGSIIYVVLPTDGDSPIYTNKIKVE